MRELSQQQKGGKGGGALINVQYSFGFVLAPDGCLPTHVNVPWNSSWFPKSRTELCSHRSHCASFPHTIVAERWEERKIKKKVVFVLKSGSVVAHFSAHASGRQKTYQRVPRDHQADPASHLHGYKRVCRPHREITLYNSTPLRSLVFCFFMS